MQALTTHKGKVALLNRANVDTDQIIPKQFLKKITKTGFGEYLFFDWRYLDNGELNSKFELNKPEFCGASILLAGDNFGCGSSREHAPWSLLEYGFRIIISSSFADIFYSNCLKNAILPIKLSKKITTDLMKQFVAGAEVVFEVDLQKQVLIDATGRKIIFEVDAFRKEFLLHGMDDIGWSLQYESDIIKFEQNQKRTQSWLWR